MRAYKLEPVGRLPGDNIMIATFIVGLIKLLIVTSVIVFHL